MTQLRASNSSIQFLVTRMPLNPASKSSFQIRIGRESDWFASTDRESRDEPVTVPIFNGVDTALVLQLQDHEHPVAEGYPAGGFSWRPKPWKVYAQLE